MLDMDISVIDSLLDGNQPHLVARQSNVSVELADNSVVGMDIDPASTNFWTFPVNTTSHLGDQIYITISACTQPSPNVNLNATEVYAKGSPPPLQLYVSTDPSNTRPGPGSQGHQETQSLLNGFANMTFGGVTSDVYISVVAPNITADWQGGWTYQLGSSTQRNHPDL
jgi:hypothetical protein